MSSGDTIEGLLASCACSMNSNGNSASVFTGNINICIGISSWKVLLSIKSIQASDSIRFEVPFNIPTNSICRKHVSSATMLPVGASSIGSVANMTSAGGLEA